MKMSIRCTYEMQQTQMEEKEYLKREKMIHADTPQPKAYVCWSTNNVKVDLEFENI